MKDPAFLFYTSDFLTGISDLTMEERGQFISLLCLQHQKGHLTEKMIRLCVGDAAADVMAKFRQDAAGLWFNARLDKEIEKRAEHSEKQRQRALDGWEKRKKNQPKNKEATADATALPLENENVNEDVNVIKEEKGGVGEKEGLIYPWDSVTFKTQWGLWKRYRKKEHGGDYFTLESEQSALRELSRNASSEKEAIQMINTAMANTWKNLYKSKDNGKQQTTIDKREQSKQDISDAVARHYAGRLASEEGRADF